MGRLSFATVVFISLIVAIGLSRGAWAEEVGLAGDLIRDCPDCGELVVVPSGEFEMGSNMKLAHSTDAERPFHGIVSSYSRAS